MSSLRVWMLLLGSCCFSPAWAAPQSALEIGPAGDYLVKSMLILLALLAVLAVMLKLLRRYGHLKNPTGKRIRVIEAITLGGHERAVLVSVDDHQILLGVSQGRVQPLMQVGAEASLTGGVAQPALTTSFNELLQTGPG